MEAKSYFRSRNNHNRHHPYLPPFFEPESPVCTSTADMSVLPLPSTLYTTSIASESVTSSPSTSIATSTNDLHTSELISKDSTNETNILKLYPELLTLIFRWLPVRDKGRAAQVCTTWRDAVYQKSVWSDVEARLHLRRAKAHVLDSLHKRGIRRIQALSIRRSLREVLNAIPNIQSLNLSGIYSINDSVFTQSLKNPIPTLTILDLSLCKQITDSSLECITRFMPNLEVLELGGCSMISNNGLLMIARHLRNLRVLNLRSCWDITDIGIAHIAGHRDFSTSSGLVRHEDYGLQSLQCLTLQDCQHLSDESLRFISVGLKSLEFINLSFCVNISDRGLRYIAKMPELEELNLRSCESITDTGIEYLADLENGAISKLKLLDVSFCDKITDQALHNISIGMTQLTSLSLSACPISDEGLQHIARSLLNLQTLNIGQCRSVTDAAITAITESLKQLTTIDLYGCNRITTHGLEMIMKLPKLKTLNLGLWVVR